MALLLSPSNQDMESEKANYIAWVTARLNAANEELELRAVDDLPTECKD